MIVSIVLLVITVARVPPTTPLTLMMVLKLMLLQLFVPLVITVLREHQKQQHIHVLLGLTMTSLESNIPTNVQTVRKVISAHVVSDMNRQVNRSPI